MECRLSRVANEWLILFVLDNLQKLTTRNLMLALFLLDYISKKRLGKTITGTRWWKVPSDEAELSLWNYSLERILLSLIARGLVDATKEVSISVKPATYTTITIPGPAQLEYVIRNLYELKELLFRQGYEALAESIAHVIARLEKVKQRIARREITYAEVEEIANLTRKLTYELREIVLDAIMRIPSEEAGMIIEKVGQVLRDLGRFTGGVVQISPLEVNISIPIPVLRPDVVITVTERGRRIEQAVDMYYLYSYRECALIKRVVEAIGNKRDTVFSSDFIKFVNELPEVKRTPVGCPVVIAKSPDRELEKAVMILRDLGVEVHPRITMENLRSLVEQVCEKVRKEETTEHPAWEYCIELLSLVDFLQETERAYRELCSKLGLELTE